MRQPGGGITRASGEHSIFIPHHRNPRERSTHEFATQLDKQKGAADKPSFGIDGQLVYTFGPTKHGDVEQSTAEQQANSHVITPKLPCTKANTDKFATRAA